MEQYSDNKKHSDESINEGSSVDLEHHDAAAVVPTTKLAADQERQTLARQETRVVMALRIVVLLVLLCTGVAMSWWTYSYTRNLEEEDFAASFSSAAQAVLESFHDAMNNNFGSVDALSAAVTEHALTTDQSFPNVTFPGFHVLAAATRVMTNAIYVFYIPLVTDATRRGYEAYCQEEQGYLFPAFFEQQTLVAVQDAYFGLEPAPLPGQRNRNRNLHFNLEDQHPTIHAEIFGSEVSTESITESWQCRSLEALINMSCCYLLLSGRWSSASRRQRTVLPSLAIQSYYAFVHALQFRFGYHCSMGRRA